MYSKINVKNEDNEKINPLFEFLTNCEANNKQPIQWNFDGKFLVNRQGQCIQRWNRKAELKTIEQFIVDKLQKSNM